MIYILYGIHIAVCVVLILVVLLQSGKAADLAGAFGGGGSQTALGSRGAATVLSKATTVCAVVFMLSSLGLALLGSRQGGSVLEQVPLPAAPAEGQPAESGGAAAEPAGGTAPATPAGEAAKPATPEGPGTPPPAAPPGSGQ